MIVGVPKEIKTEENRVAVTPTGVAGFVSRGHKVLIEKGAGLGSGLTDRAYEVAGATLVESAQEVWNQSDLIMKVKEPQVSEFPLLRRGLILFTYLHLAANESVTRELLERKVTGIAYETIQLEDGSLPLLTPMSEIAGRLSIQVGAWCLQAENGGRGILLGGASGVRPGKVVILGAGMSGTAACQVAAGMGSYVSILDIHPTKLRYVHDILGGHVTTLMSNRANVEEEVVDADLVIGSVLIPGAKAPRTCFPLFGSTDEAGFGVRRYFYRPGRLCRDFPSYDPSPAHLCRRGCCSLLRDEHAGQRAQHIDLCADKLDALLRAGAG